MVVTLLTPTGSRPLAFALCESFMERQSYEGDVQWVVVDDGETPTPISENSRVTTVIRRRPQGDQPGQLLLANLRAAWFGGHVRGDVVLFIEDDDWYPRTYVADQVTELQKWDMAGESPYRVYHVPTGRWAICQPYQGSALSRTAIRTEALARVPLCNWEAGTVYFDALLWGCGEIRNTHVYAREDGRGVVGMKGMPGRRGLSPGHDPNMEEYAPDAGGEVLRRWVGDDCHIYASLRRGRETA